LIVLIVFTEKSRGVITLVKKIFHFYERDRSEGGKNDAPTWNPKNSDF
jgi:hypothetical protein